MSAQPAYSDDFWQTDGNATTIGEIAPFRLPRSRAYCAVLQLHVRLPRGHFPARYGLNAGTRCYMLILNDLDVPKRALKR